MKASLLLIPKFCTSSPEVLYLISKPRLCLQQRVETEKSEGRLHIQLVHKTHRLYQLELGSEVRERLGLRWNPRILA